MQKSALCPAACRFDVLLFILFDLYREIKLYYNILSYIKLKRTMFVYLILIWLADRNYGRKSQGNE